MLGSGGVGQHREGEARLLFERLHESIWRSVITVAGGYLLFGLLWILLSDWVVELVAPSRADLSAWQTYQDGEPADGRGARL